MDLALLERRSEHEWMAPSRGKMRVPAILFATESLIRDMDQKVYEQITNVATLPGIQKAAYAMPDAHWGYGFPIGGVAAFDANEGGVISAGGVGFDISCGVRTLVTALGLEDVDPVKEELAEALFRSIPAGVGSRGKIHLSREEVDEMLSGGASWAVGRGWGQREDLERIEERGAVPGAEPDKVSDDAKKRQLDEMGTLGSGNHYLEVQKVAELCDVRVAEGYGLRVGDIVISIHCGSRGLGHQIGTDYLRKMVIAAGGHGIELPDRELACVPLRSALGQSYIGAMRAGTNCALANRQIITHLVRETFSKVLPKARLRLLYDVSHNTCKEEEHRVDLSQVREIPEGRGQAETLRHGKIRDVSSMHIDAFAEGPVFSQRREAILSELQCVRKSCRRERQRGRSGICARHVRHAIVNDTMLFEHRIRMRGRPRGFDRAALVDADVHDYRAGLHTLHHFFRDHDGRPSTSEEHGSHDEIRILQTLGDSAWLRDMESDGCGKLVFDLLEPFDALSKNKRSRADRIRRARGMETDDSVSDNHNFPISLTEHAAE